VIPSSAWRYRHLLDVDALSADDLSTVMAVTDAMTQAVGGDEAELRLARRRVVLLFAEPSTRTRVSFEMAARRLGAEVTEITVASSSVAKGESLVDTVRTLAALGADALVLRHSRSGAPYLAAEHFPGAVINGGDGWHAHPTQALLDLYTLRAAWGADGLAGRKVVIVGDILHSRVARSNVWSLTAMGVDLWLCGPASLLRGFDLWARALPGDRRLTVSADVDRALAGADAVMALRLQQERMAAGLIPSVGEYVTRYGLTRERLALAKPDALVLHPGPMNEGVEIAPDVAIGPASRVLDQVRHGVAVRMAVLSLLLAA
jgi:aspartate carbamoyltransferase catalytic subunit